MVENFQGEDIRREVGFPGQENHRAQGHRTVQGADGPMVLQEWRGSGEESGERQWGLEGGRVLGPMWGFGFYLGGNVATEGFSCRQE